MVTVIQNVTRDMREISCYADNGYGTPMQASRTITISREYPSCAEMMREAITPQQPKQNLNPTDSRQNLTLHKLPAESHPPSLFSPTDSSHPL